MKNLTPELIAKAKEAKSAEQLLALAKENGVELTSEEANTYFEQLNANVALSDDDLDAVSGGSDCPKGEETNTLKIGTKVKVIDGSKCKCGGNEGHIALDTTSRGNIASPTKIVRCSKCGLAIITRPTNEQVEVI
jgi:hypothetical protein